VAAGRPVKSSPVVMDVSEESQSSGNKSYEPSLISSFRPFKGFSERAIAIVLASGEAKSTYANLDPASAIALPSQFRERALCFP
jgi:hypothetical protein